MRFVKVTKKELPKVWKFFAGRLGEYFPQYSPKSIEFFMKDYDQKWLSRAISNERRQIWAAYEKNEPVGYLIAMKQYGGVAFANWLAVKKEMRNKRIATKLIELWERQALSDGSHKLYLWTSKGNLEFYKKLGFVVVGEFPDGYFGSSDFILYKTLRKSDEKKFLGLKGGGVQ